MTETPLRKRQRRTRQAILDAAVEMIRTQGIDGLSWRGIARKVDYSPSGLYEYFDSKDEIVQTLATQGRAILEEYLLKSDSSKSLADQLVEMGLAYIRFGHDYPVHFEIAFTALRSNRSSLEEAPGGAYGHLYDLVLRGQEQGMIRISDRSGADAITYLLWSLFHGMATLQLTHLRGFDADFEQVDRAGIEAFVRGLSVFDR